LTKIIEFGCKGNRVSKGVTIVFGLGVSPLEQSFKIEVYPNPVLGEKIYFKSAVPKKTAEIFNLVGRLVSQSANSKEGTIDESNLASGIYTLKINTIFESLSRKIVISEKN